MSKIHRAALLGYGRFGAALASLLEASGAGVRAHDPQTAVPAALRAPTLPDLVDGAEVVFLAVPISELEPALRRLRPHLNAGHLVLDVSSVKVLPQALMTALLGSDVPWVATHPLFGPTSLALGERPLHVVVCPNPCHPDAPARARAVYEALGCEIIEQEADEHDRSMARTHALAFFVAKGLLDIGIDEVLHAAPPSFRALARTVEAVRSDAGHLFAAIHLDNPYAAEARRALLDALTRTDEQLRAGADRPVISAREEGAGGAALATSPVSELEQVRQRIDELDGELLALLGRRAALARTAGRAKASAGRPVLDAPREEEVLARTRQWAERAGLDVNAAVETFQAILRLSRKAQGEAD